MQIYRVTSVDDRVQIAYDYREILKQLGISQDIRFEKLILVAH